MQKPLNEGKTISVLGKKGKFSINPDVYENILSTYDVDCSECAYDGVTPNNCSKKRILKSFERTKYFIEHFFNEVDGSKKVFPVKHVRCFPPFHLN
jgi:hypothetical protein